MNNLKRFDYKKIAPHILAIVIFLAISSAYFLPQLSGYRLHQGDNITSIGMSKEIRDFRDKYDSEPLWTNSMFSGMPAYQISVKNTNLISALDIGLMKLIPRPIGYMFLLMIGFYILLLCMDVDPRLAIIGAIAFGFSSYNMLYLSAGHNSKIHAIAFIPPVIGSILYAYRKNYLIGSALLAFFTCLHLSANHLQMTYYMLYLILAIGIVEFIVYLQKKLFPKFIKVTLFLLLGGLLGILPTVSNILMTKEYSAYTTRGKSELTINSANEKVSEEENSALAPDYIKQYSLGFGEVWSLVIPNVKGGQMGYLGSDKDLMKHVEPALQKSIAQHSRYWGEQYGTGGAFYFGATIFLLFILGVVFVKDKTKWAFVAISALAIILSWKYGKITDFFIHNIPMYKQFRDTKMMLVLAQVSFAMLGAMFIHFLLTNKINQRKLLYTLLAVIGLIGLFYLVPNLWFNFLSKAEQQNFNELTSTYRNNPSAISQISAMQDALKDVRIIIFRKDVLRSLFFILVIAALVYLYSIQKLKQLQLILALGFFILIDLWIVDKRYLNNEKKGKDYLHWVDTYKYKNPFTPSTADQYILNTEMAQNPALQNTIQDELSKFKKERGLKSNQFKNEQDKIRFRELNFATDYRVLNLADPFNESRTSYYHKSLGGYHGAKLKKYQELIEYHISPEIRSIIGTLQNNPTPGALDSLFRMGIPVLNMLNTKYIVYNPDARPLINPYAAGNAWFVNEVRMVVTADEEIMALNSLHPGQAITREKYASSVPEVIVPDSAARILLTDYKPNHLTYSSSSASEQLAVFSEIFYDAGWNAYIDGEKSEYFKANYILRAMKVPAGNHTIEFRFEPVSYAKGRKLAGFGSLLIILYILGVIGWEVWSRRKTAVSAEG